MTELADKRCVPCEGGVEPLDSDAIDGLQGEVPDWNVVERDGVQRLERAYTLENFERALQLAERVGRAAEEQGHHPVLVTEWGRVTVTWWTHAIGGLHENDFVMAARTDQIYRQLTG